MKKINGKINVSGLPAGEAGALDTCALTLAARPRSFLTCFWWKGF
jgi:hypothetical protein